MARGGAVWKLVGLITRRSEVRIFLPQPTMRTDLDIGARNPVTTTVTGFFIPFFQVKLNRYPKPKTAFGEDLN